MQFIKITFFLLNRMLVCIVQIIHVFDFITHDRIKATNFANYRKKVLLDDINENFFILKIES